MNWKALLPGHVNFISHRFNSQLVSETDSKFWRQSTRAVELLLIDLDIDSALKPANTQGHSRSLPGQFSKIPWDYTIWSWVLGWVSRLALTKRTWVSNSLLFTAPHECMFWISLLEHQTVISIFININIEDMLVYRSILRCIYKWFSLIYLRGNLYCNCTMKRV